MRETGIRHVTRILESMPKVGATVLNGVSYAGWQAMPDHGITMDEKRRKEDLAVDSMKKLMKVAEDNGVIYCCEVVNRFEQYLLNTAAEGVAFVGDTLFPGSHGRTDLAGGDEGQIMASLHRMALEIAPATTLLCGHGPATTMARELALNPFLL